MIDKTRALSMVQERCDFALQRHLAFVAKGMEKLAHHLGYPNDAEKWYISGLLHDIDWNATITEPKKHCGPETIQYLKKHGIDDDICEVIRSHCEWLQIPRDNDWKKAIFAVDELSGFIVAAALVRPTKMIGISAKSIIKKMKSPSFAAAVSRDDMKSCEKYFQIPLVEFINILLPVYEKLASDWELK